MKDSIKGKSIGKKIFGLSLVDSNRGEPISPLKSVFNNAMSIFLPINLFLFIITKGKKGVGDFFVKSLAVPSSKVLNKSQFRMGNFMLAALISFLLLAFISIPDIIRKINGSSIVYYANSYNISQSKSIQLIFQSESPFFSDVSVKLYDSCVNIPVPYLTIQFLLKEEWSEYGTMDSLHKETVRTLDSFLKGNSLRADILYRLESNNQVSIWTMDYGYGSVNRFGFKSYLSF